jgi:hypothetical protein
MSIAAGVYRGRAVAGSEQYGTTNNGTDQIAIDLDLDGGHRVSTFLYFSDKAAKYSIQRLRSLGWQGSDLSNLVGIDANDVDVEIKYEEYQGELKMKVNIVAGGTVTLDKPLDDKGKKAFAARFKALASESAPKVPNGTTGGAPF